MRAKTQRFATAMAAPSATPAAGRTPESPSAATVAKPPAMATALIAARMRASPSGLALGGAAGMGSVVVGVIGRVGGMAALRSLELVGCLGFALEPHGGGEDGPKPGSHPEDEAEEREPPVRGKLLI